MDLSRTGANRKEVRSTAFSNHKPTLTIDPQTGSISLVVRRGDGMGASGQYDYTIVISTADLSAMLEVVSKERTAFQDGPLKGALEASAAYLLRLLAAASALPYQLAPTEAQLRMQAVKRKIEAKRNSTGEA